MAYLKDRYMLILLHSEALVALIKFNTAGFQLKKTTIRYLVSQAVPHLNRSKMLTENWLKSTTLMLLVVRHLTLRSSEMLWRLLEYSQFVSHVQTSTYSKRKTPKSTKRLLKSSSPRNIVLIWEMKLETPQWNRKPQGVMLLNEWQNWNNKEHFTT